MFQGDTAHGSKKFKDRVTLLLTCSWSGEKMKPTLIGKFEKPRALKDADMKRIPVHYRAQKSSWMTSQPFTDFLQWFDTEVGKKEQNRKFCCLWIMPVCIILQSRTSRRSTPRLCSSQNTTSCTQPLDAGLIQTFKLLYRKSLHNHVLYTLKQKFQNENSEDPYKTISIALVICWATRAWNQVQPRTISRCFSKCGFMQNEGPVANIGMPEVTLEELELQAMEAADAGIVFAPTKTITQLVKEAMATVGKVREEDPQKTD